MGQFLRYRPTAGRMSGCSEPGNRKEKDGECAVADHPRPNRAACSDQRTFLDHEDPAILQFIHPLNEGDQNILSYKIKASYHMK